MSSEHPRRAPDAIMSLEARVSELEVALDKVIPFLDALGATADLQREIVAIREGES